MKISGSIWGIQPISFNEIRKYLIIRHAQNKEKLQRIMQELQIEESRMQMRIAFFQSSCSDSTSETTPPDVQVSPVAWDESWFESLPHFKIKYKKRLFGLRTKEVHAYLENLKMMQWEELQAIRKELTALLERRKQLQIKLGSFESTNHQEETAVSLETTEEEAHLRTAEKGILQEADSMEEGLTQDIQNAETPDDENTRAKLEQQWKAKLECEIKEQLLIQLQSHLLSKQPYQTEEDWVCKIQEMIKQKIIEGQKQINSRSNVIVFQNKGQRQTNSNLAAMSKQQRLTVNGADFWGEDIEPLLFLPQTGYEEEGAVYVPVSVHPEIAMGSDSFPQDRGIESKQSPAVANQAYLLKQKYIVGKLAGADLKDSSGKIIVAKNEMITEQAMNQAEQQGKLAELIVNMMIPGLGEFNGSS